MNANEPIEASLDADGQFKLLLQFLAADPDAQIRVFVSWKKDKELLKLVKNPLQSLLGLCPQEPFRFVFESKLDSDTQSLLSELRWFLEKFSYDESAGLWFENGLKKRNEWALARRLARIVLERIGWPAEMPTLSQGIWHNLLVDTID